MTSAGMQPCLFHILVLENDEIHNQLPTQHHIEVRLQSKRVEGICTYVLGYIYI